MISILLKILVSSTLFASFYSVSLDTQRDECMYEEQLNYISNIEYLSSIKFPINTPESAVKYATSHPRTISTMRDVVNQISRTPKTPQKWTVCVISTKDKNTQSWIIKMNTINIIPRYKIDMKILYSHSLEHQYKNTIFTRSGWDK